jgi:hypothetical protein
LGRTTFFVKKILTFWKILKILENFDKILEKYPGKKNFWKFWKIFVKFFTKCKKLEISGGITLQKDKFTAVIKCATSEKLWKK